MSNEAGFLSAGAQVRYRTILRNVYMWMTLGLGITAAVSWWIYTNPSVQQTLFSRGAMPFFLLMIGELVLVMVLSRRIMQMSVPAAVGCFSLYSVLNGITISLVLLAYAKIVIFQAFAVSAGMFAVMSLWAVTTKKDLSGWGHFLFMGLIGLLIAGIVGMFFQSETFGLLYSGIGVILFTALTAYDTQMIKKMSDSLSAEVGETDYVRLSVLGALKLYLDFINMFLFLLRIFGRRR